MKKETPPTPTKEQYLEPVGFKGTPGEWDRIKYTIFGNSSQEIVAKIDAFDESEKEPNAKLISQSKELAKALQRAKETIETLADELNYSSARWRSEHLQPIEQVLKEAGLTNE